MKINVAFCIDKNYIKQCYVLIVSILKVSKENDQYDFFILADDDISDVLSLQLLSLENIYSNCHIRFIYMGTRVKEGNLHIKHITSATYFRLLLPELILEDKCIYLDTDVIVCEDLSELYDIPIDGYEIGGVKASIYHHLSKQEKEEYKRQTGLPSMDEYINAGILLLNLKLMRENNFTDNAMQLIGHVFPTQDQDIINLICYGKIKHLPLKYNIPARDFFTCKSQIINNVFGQEEWENEEKKPHIIHYYGANKPWIDVTVSFAEKWWEACRSAGLISEFMFEAKDIFYYYGVICQKTFWKCTEFSTEWINNLKEFDGIYVYGAGQVGVRIVHELRKKKIFVTAVLVSRKMPEGQRIEDVEIQEFSNQVDKRALIILGVSWLYRMEIINKLFREGYFNVYMLSNGINESAEASE